MIKFWLSKKLSEIIFGVIGVAVVIIIWALYCLVLYISDKREKRKCKRREKCKMTKETLQAELDKNEIKAKVLRVRKTKYEDYEVIFTRDLNYSITESELSRVNFITEPQEDCLVEDLTDAVSEIRYLMSNKAWYEYEQENY